LSRLLKSSQLIDCFSSYLKDRHHKPYTEHKYADLLRLHLLMVCGDYEDCNDIQHLSDDQAVESLFDSKPSQNTLSWFENAMNLYQVFTMAQGMIDNYVDNLDPRRKEIVIDVVCTNDPTHGKQQGSLFHGYHWQYQYNELFCLNWQTGQVSFPVLRQGILNTS